MNPLQETILIWYSKEKRDLPWRTTTDPYRILVSEMMLQQTQVDRVLLKYKEFLIKFPTAKDLAAASSGEVIKAWQGLGFNRRALRLQEIAKQVSKKFPTTEKELLSLKGIGPYTASAISSFAFNQDVVVLDTNIRRVFHRIFLGTVKKDNELLNKELELVAEKNLPYGRSRDWYNALMDLGATICLASNPKCTVCPVQKECTFTKILEEATPIEREELLKLTRVKNKQGVFKNSNRYYRGRILDYLRKEGTLPLKELEKHFREKYNKDVSFILVGLEKDKLISLKKDKISLPG